MKNDPSHVRASRQTRPCSLRRSVSPDGCCAGPVGRHAGLLRRGNAQAMDDLVVLALNERSQGNVELNVLVGIGF